jgi:hypothetical protein
MNIAQTIRSTFNKIKAIAQPQIEAKESAKESTFHTPIQAMKRPSHSKTVVREKNNSLPIKEIKVIVLVLAIFASFWMISSNKYVANFVIQSLVEMDVIPKSSQQQIQEPSQSESQMQMPNQESNQSQSSDGPGLLD